MDGEAGWWTTCGNIGLPPLARVMGMGRQQQQCYMKVQEYTACTRLDCCKHLHKLCLHNPCHHGWGPDSVSLAIRRSLPAAWLALLLTKAGDAESNPGPTTHINKHTPVMWICDLCHKQINKKQTSIRCNHTHNTHWVYLKYTHIQLRQYKPDWRCTIHTPTQNVTTTQLPITNNHHPPTQKQQSTKGQKHRHTSNQHKRHQKQNRGTKKPSTQHPSGHHHNTRNKTHKES